MENCDGDGRVADSTNGSKYLQEPNIFILIILSNQTREIREIISGIMLYMKPNTPKFPQLISFLIKEGECRIQTQWEMG